MVSSIQPKITHRWVPALLVLGADPRGGRSGLTPDDVDVLDYLAGGVVIDRIYTVK